MRRFRSRTQTEFPHGFTDMLSTVTVIITNVSKESNPLPRASLAISAPLSERGHAHGASRSLSQRPVPGDAQPRNDGPPPGCPPIRPSPRPGLSHFPLGNDREMLFLSPALSQPPGLGFPHSARRSPSPRAGSAKPGSGAERSRAQLWGQRAGLDRA